MHLKILSALSEKNFNINWIEVSSSNSDLVIQHGHAPMIISLKENSKATFYLKNGKTEQIDVHAGVLEVSRTTCLLILM